MKRDATQGTNTLTFSNIQINIKNSNLLYARSERPLRCPGYGEDNDFFLTTMYKHM